MFSFSDYLKRDDQYLAFRLQNEENRNRMAKSAKDRDRALAMAKANDLGIPEADTEIDGVTNMEDGAEDAQVEAVGSKVIAIHVGSQNLRIGLASDALPKTVPMVIARKSNTSESEDAEEPTPKRVKLDDGSPIEPEKMFGSEVSSTQQHFRLLSAEFLCLADHISYSSRRNMPRWPQI